MTRGVSGEATAVRIDASVVAQSDDGWRASATETMQSFTKDKTAEFYTPKLDDAAWGWVAKRLHYLRGDFSKHETFSEIGNSVGDGSVVF